MRLSPKKHFPIALKESVARRYLSTDASYRVLAEEVGADPSTVRAWVVELRNHGTVRPRKGKAMPTDSRSAEEKLRLVFTAKGLAENERGEFLRREGIHDADLERWEEEALSGLQGGVSHAAQERRIRELERARSKQDKRLKEASALLELQKKVHALWGDEDDDTPPT